mgnify:CR=1 FL=1
MIKDTIAAIATAMSSSGIGIVRMSGPDSFEIIDKIFAGNYSVLKTLQVFSFIIFIRKSGKIVVF